jgi:ketosteroid isomerase-like protein
MGQENVEVVRRFFDAWNSGDLDKAYEACHPDMIMRMEGNWPEPGPYFGRDAVRRWDTEFRDTWDTVTTKPITQYLHTADRVVSRYALHGVGQGPASNIEVTMIHTLRQGKIREVEFHWDHDEALEAVGLSESGS